jgi:plasmid stabilization system protein ParE
MQSREFHVHPEAKEEAALAGEWYFSHDPVAGVRFLGALRRAVERVVETPLSWPRYIGRTRFVRLRRFPYIVVYRVTRKTLKVIAIAHTSRKPGYWKSRL